MASMRKLSTEIFGSSFFSPFLLIERRGSRSDADVKRGVGQNHDSPVLARNLVVRAITV
jgi:hypothetical protein